MEDITPPGLLLPLPGDPCTTGRFARVSLLLLLLTGRDGGSGMGTGCFGDGRGLNGEETLRVGVEDSAPEDGDAPPEGDD